MNRRQPSKTTRNMIYNFYDGLCVFCSPDKGKLVEWHCDHFDPWSKSRTTSLSMLVVACPPHNLQKKDSESKAWLDLMKSANPMAYRKFMSFNGFPVVEEIKVIVQKEPEKDFRLYPKVPGPLDREFEEPLQPALRPAFELARPQEYCSQFDCATKAGLATWVVKR